MADRSQRSQRMKFLIVNADDLGRTPGINSGIFEAHARGLVTSATLMVGFPAAAEAAAELLRYPKLGVGLHVALTGGTPILPPEDVPSLVDREGRQPPRPEGLGDLDPGELRAEIEAQLDRFRQLVGRPPTHFDSHHHSHRLPIVCDALIEIARREGLPVRRASAEIGERLLRGSVRTTDVFVEEFFGSKARPEVFSRIVRSVAAGVTELMCHPGHVDEELRQGSSYAVDRAAELEVLTDPELVRLIRDEGIGLIHYGEL